LLWPALCLVFFRKHIGLAALLAIAAIASFAFNVATVRTAPDIAFYSPASRFWELMVGGMVAHAQLAGRLPGARLADPLAWLGVAMIAGGLALISSEDPFPGWLALLPVLGTAAILAAGPAAVVNRHALALRPLAFVGLISYPLYLWHWPILSFLRIMAPGE